MENIFSISVKDKLEQIKSRKLTAIENTEAALARIKNLNPKINAFIELNEKGALDTAKWIDEKIKQGKKVGKLAGLIVAVKSNINVTGLHVTCASKTLEDYVGTFDAAVVQRIKSEDGIIIGMTNMDEFAAGSSGETSAWGPTDNPSALGHIPGGSSSGSAAAVAVGICDLAIGSDTGGSIRNPASHCGIVGLKPTYGLVPRHGLIDLAMSLDQIGPMARDVYGCALLLEVIAGYNSRECTTLKVDLKDFTKKVDADIKGLKIGIAPQYEEVTVDKKIYQKIERAIEILKDLGARVVQVNLPNLKRALPAYYLINYVEFFSATRRFDGRRYGKRIEDVCGEEVLRRILLGSYISQKEYRGKYYHKAIKTRSVIKHETLEAFKQADVLISPTVPKLPHKFGAKLTPFEMYGYDLFTVPTNLSGICAGVVPVGKIDGIPIGLQIQGKPLDELTIFKIMEAYEKSTRELS